MNRKGGVSTPFAIGLLLVTLSMILVNVVFVDYEVRRFLRETAEEDLTALPGQLSGLAGGAPGAGLPPASEPKLYTVIPCKISIHQSQLKYNEIAYLATLFNHGYDAIAVANITIELDYEEWPANTVFHSVKNYYPKEPVLTGPRNNVILWTFSPEEGRVEAKKYLHVNVTVVHTPPGEKGTFVGRVTVTATYIDSSGAVKTLTVVRSVETSTAGKRLSPFLAFYSVAPQDSATLENMQIAWLKADTVYTFTLFVRELLPGGGEVLSEATITVVLQGGWRDVTAKGGEVERTDDAVVITWKDKQLQANKQFTFSARPPQSVREPGYLFNCTLSGTPQGEEIEVTTISELLVIVGTAFTGSGSLELINTSPHTIHLVAVRVANGTLNERLTLNAWLRPAEIYKAGEVNFTVYGSYTAYNLTVYTAAGPVTYTFTVSDDNEPVVFRLKFVSERGNLFLDVLEFWHPPPL